MKKELIGILVCMLLVGTILPVTGNVLVDKNPVSYISGNTLYVGGSGPDNYTKIQDAIDNAIDSDTVFVYDDSSPYYENIEIRKSISLVGEDKNTTVIEGSEYFGSSGVIEVYVEGINISGFTIRYDVPNPSVDNYGIFVVYAPWGLGNKSIINGNIITNTWFGIRFEGSNENRVFDNYITNSHVGIGIGVTWVLGIPCYNHVYEKGIVGTYGCPFYNHVYENEIKNCNTGILLAVTYGNCKYNYIYKNLIWKNRDGIGLSSGFGDAFVDDNYIFCNNILYNQEGLYFNAGEIKPPPKNNHIDGNNFIGNIDYNVRFLGRTGLNYWDDKGFGNFWDHYTGKDNDGDGIGDTPYIINKSHGVVNKDNFPLMEPFGDFDPDAPNTPEINGQTKPKAGVEYEYTFVTIDPNGDDVFYYISWGDGNFEEWIGPFKSGEEVIRSHTWSDKKNRVITAQAMDTNGLVGGWGTLPIIMPRNRATYNSLFLQLLELFPILKEVILRLIR